ncbi:MAG: HAD-IIA family hydrolase [Streptosporangiaceae bacterium]
MTEPRGERPTKPLRACPKPLAEAYDTILSDLDGVVYLAGEPVRGTGEALEGAKTRGARVAFVTNNASRTPAAVAGRLRELGTTANTNDVVTSAQAAARLVARRVPPGSAVLVVGGAGLRQAVRAHGLRPVTLAADNPAAVVEGFVATTSYDMLREGGLAVRRGALFVASNADVTMPTIGGQVPGNGSLLRVIATATGQEPLVAGKPERPLFDEALRRTRARLPLVVGDRLDTDIEGAARADMPSLLVLTGVTSAFDLLRAPARCRPTYIAPDAYGLLSAHPEVERVNGVWRCRGWSVWMEEGGWLIEDAAGSVPGADAHDGLRALCAAVWASPDAVDDRSLAHAVDRLGLVSRPGAAVK